MFCSKCGKENPNGAVYCSACGARINAVQEQRSVVKESVEGSSKKKSSLWKWLLWWEVDNEELRRQVENYNDLKVTSSYRGIAALLLGFSTLLTFVFILSGLVGSDAFIDIIVLVVLSFLVYAGYGWAMVGAMVYWTFSKIVGVVESPSTVLMHLVWWTAYMSAFFRAWKVEKERQALY